MTYWFWVHGDDDFAHIYNPKQREHLENMRRSSREVRANLGLTRPHHCYYCRKPGDPVLELTLDHKLPKSRGGRMTDDNLELACLECNGKKGSLTEQEFLAVLACGDKR